MIQLQICSICLTEVDSMELPLHQSRCLSSRNSGKLQQSMKSTQQMVRIGLTANHIMPYMNISKFSRTLIEQASKIIERRFEDFKAFYFKFNQQRLQISIVPNQNLDPDRQRSVKMLIEDKLNSYEVISLAIDQAYLQLVSHLEDQFVLEISQSSVLILLKKDKTLQRIVEFFQKLISLSKLSKRIALQSQILEFEDEKQKEVRDIVKSIGMFITNADQVNIKIKSTQKKCFVFICGQKQAIHTCIQYIKESISSNRIEIGSKKFRISQEEERILKKQKIMQKYKEEYGINYEYKSFTITRTVKLNQHSTIYLLCSPSLLVIPKSAVVIVKQEFLKEIKQIQESVQCLKDYIFYSQEGGGSVEDALKEFISYYIDAQGEFAVILPNAKKQQFIRNIVNFLSTVSSSIKLYLLERLDQNQAIDSLSACFNKQKKWTVTIKGKKVFYPQNVNDQIQSALENGITNLIITHKELGIKKVTHRLTAENSQQIFHIQTGIPAPIFNEGGKLVTFLNQESYFIEQNMQNPEQLTLAVFQLNLLTRTQRSLVTDEELPMSFELIETFNKKKMVEPEKDMVELVIKYPDLESIDQIWRSIHKKIQEKLIIKSFQVSGMGSQKTEEIRNWCRLNNIQLEIKDSRMTASSYNQANIQNLQKLIQINQNISMQFPKYWVVDQTEDLRMYDVAEDSQQFNQVQLSFTVAKIKKLQRVQNKILFEKYNTQRQFLSKQNGSKVRELMMYHGTRANPPEMIYNDREESFNINYANMGSYGKGIYFAKQSEYSNNYCYMKRGSKLKQMFYCLVLAGHSQTYNGKQTHNTSFRDEIKRIRYESVADSKAETIIVVFKNRRAYPLYLISY